MSQPPLGWIKPVDRSLKQIGVHSTAAAKHLRRTLPFRAPAVGEKLLLTSRWNHPDVVAETGIPLTRKHQLTGSCVDAGYMNAIMSTICAQRLSGVEPTKAFIPFTYHNYAMSRHYFGDDSEGDGSMGSTIAKSGAEDGLRDWPQVSGDELPEYSYDLEDGFMTSEKIEYKWSSYRNPDLQKVLTVAKANKFQGIVECLTVEDILAALQNGYGVTWACNNFISNAKVVGSGENAVCLSEGGADSSGGHQWSIQGYWNHPELGLLFNDLNNWDKSTYPRDPAGGITCSCWRKEAKVKSNFRLDSEVYAYGRLPWMPAQPKVMEDFIIHV